MTTGAFDPTGVAVTVDDVIWSTAFGSGVHAIRSCPPLRVAVTPVGAAGGTTSRYARKLR